MGHHGLELCLQICERIVGYEDIGMANKGGGPITYTYTYGGYDRR